MVGGGHRFDPGSVHEKLLLMVTTPMREEFLGLESKRRGVFDSSRLLTGRLAESG